MFFAHFSYDVMKSESKRVKIIFLSVDSATFFIEILNIFHMFQISYRLDDRNNLSFQRIKIENN